MAPKKEKKAAEKAAEGSAGVEEVKNTRPEKPDEEYYNKLIEEKQAQIKAKKDAISELVEKIRALSHGKTEYDEEKSKLFEIVNATKEERAQLVAQKTEVFRKMKAQKQEAREAKESMRKLEVSMEMTEHQIDEEIQKIEYRMGTTTMDLKQEKECMMQIKKLKAKKPQVIQAAKQYERMKAQCQAATAPDPTKSLDEQLAEMNEKINVLQERQNGEYAKITELKEKRQKQMGGVDGHLQQKNKLKEECDALQQERTRITDERRQKQRLFYEWEKEQRAEKRRKQELEWSKAQAEWEANEAKRELEKPRPYLDETTLLEQTIDYCKNLIGQGESNDAADEVKETKHNNPEGAMILVSKKDREAEFYFAPTKKKNLKKKGGEKAKARSIPHTADTFAIFEKLGVPAPMSTDDVAPLLAKLEAQLADYYVKVKAWEAEREVKVKAMEETVKAEGGEAPVEAA